MQKKKSKTLYFIRHGETDFNTDPIPRVRGRVPIGLNEAGLRHAKQAGEFLKDTKISSIYYSAVNRAQQTAQAVYEYHKDAKFVEEPLVLDISWGDWEGKTYEEALGDPKGGDYVKNPSRLLVPNGESFYSVVDRFRKFLFRILDSDEDDVCVVSHATNLNLLWCYIIDAPYNKFVKCTMSPCGVSKVIMEDIDDIRIKYWNACHFLK